MPARPDPLRLPEAVIVLVTASWCLPCRPAITVLRELQPRWGEETLAAVVEDPDPRVLDQLDVDQLPTWIRLTPSDPSAKIIPADDGHALRDEPASHTRADTRSTEDADGSPGAESVSHDEPADSRVIRTESFTRRAGATEDPDPMPHGDEPTFDAPLRAQTILGPVVEISGEWSEPARRVGATPKLEIDALARSPLSASDD